MGLQLAQATSTSTKNLGRQSSGNNLSIEARDFRTNSRQQKVQGGMAMDQIVLL